MEASDLNDLINIIDCDLKINAQPEDFHYFIVDEDVFNYGFYALAYSIVALYTTNEKSYGDNNDGIVIAGCLFKNNYASNSGGGGGYDS